MTAAQGHRSRTFEEAVDAYLTRSTRRGECLVAPVTTSRYGEITWDQGRHRMLAHRAVYLAKVGPIGDGQVVRHRCDNGPCVEARHLELGTIAQNVRDIYDRERRDAPWLRGSAHSSALLTEDVVRDARRRACDGESLHELADRYGVNYLTLAAAIRGRTWRHVVDVPPVLGQVRAASTRSLIVSQPEQCRVAAELAAQGLALAQIGERLSVSRSTAFRLVRAGRTLAGAR